MRRKIKPKVVWLPNTNANSLGQLSRSTYQEFVLNPAGAGGAMAVGEIPIVIDSDQDPIGAEDVSLSDIFNSGYRLRRLVGKVWCTIAQDSSDGPVVVIVKAGFIIRRADNTGTSLALQAGVAENLDPGDIENASDPWIWQRQWILRNIIASNQPATADRFVVGATSNFGPFYGSAVDGPHVDVKTGRIVSQEERLFLDVSATVLIPGADPQVTADVAVLCDIRALATLRTSVGNRRNASR